jgi:ribosomal protein S18 acetylase RimI-like enzyme
MAEHKIVSLEKSHIQEGTVNLTEAFFPDPLMEFMAPDPAKRRKVSPWMWSSMLKYGVRWGVTERDATGKGATMWLPPGQTTMTMTRLIRTPLIQVPFRLGLGGMMRFNSAMTLTEKAHKRLMPEPHWYLGCIGVHPSAQGTGIGSALLQHGLDRADAAKQRVYLETATDYDVAFYSKRGFEVKETIEIEGLTARLMVRPAKT